MKIVLVVPAHDDDTRRPLHQLGAKLSPSHSVLTIRCESDPLVRMRQIYREIEQNIDGDTTVVAPTPCFAARIAHEKLGVPLVSIIARPEPILWGPVAARVPLTVRGPWLQWIDRGAERNVADEVDLFRRELELPRLAEPLSTWIHSPQRVIAPFPRWFAPRSFRPSAQAQRTGLIVCGAITGETLAEPLRAFLEAGTSPIVFRVRPQLIPAARNICRELVKRGVVVGASESGSDDQFHLTPAAPPELLMQWANCVVHHGEIAITIAALAAGIPQLIVPTDAAERALARRLSDLGVAGESPRLDRKAVEGVLYSTAIARRCASVASRVRSEDGASRAARIITGEPEPAPIPSTRRYISISSLGNFGRFGNQCLQYGFLRVLAHVHGYEPLCSPWSGMELFGQRDRPCTSMPLLRPAIERRIGPMTVFDVLPELTHGFEVKAKKRSIRIGPEAIANCPPNIDLCGNFMYRTSCLAPYKEFWRSVFEPVPELKAALDEGIAKLRQRGKTLIGIHVRRGDFARLPMATFTWLVSDAAWKRWVASVWRDEEQPVLYIASDEPDATVKALAEYQPVVEKDLGITLPPSCKSYGYIIDHYVLSQCDVVAVSNSSFGFSACMLNRTAREFHRTTPSGEFARFDPWDAHPLLHTSDVGIVKSRADMIRLLRQGGSSRGIWSSLLVDFAIVYLWVCGMRIWLGGRSRGLLGMATTIPSCFLGLRTWRYSPSPAER